MSTISVIGPRIVNFDDMHPACLCRNMQGDFTIAEAFAEGAFPAENLHPASISQNNTLSKITPITDGYGELVVMVEEGASFRAATKQEFVEIYLSVFKKHVPSLEATIPKPYKTRIEQMREQGQAINSKYKLIFVPRIYLELVFFQELISEDCEKAKRVAFKDPENPTKEESDELFAVCHISANSWANTGEVGPSRTPSERVERRLYVQKPSDEDQFRLIEIAEKLNHALCKRITALAPNLEHLTFGQIQLLLEDQISFLKEFPKTSHGKFARTFLSTSPAAYFEEMMSKKAEKAALIFRRFAVLECAKFTKGKIIASRGGNILEDSPVKNGTPHRLSFGSSALAGFTYDFGACAFAIMMNSPDGYSFVLDPKIVSADVVNTPPISAVGSLFGQGEIWHWGWGVSEMEHSYTGSRGGEIRGSPLSTKQLCEEFVSLRKYKRVVLTSNH